LIPLFGPREDSQHRPEFDLREPGNGRLAVKENGRCQVSTCAPKGCKKSPVAARRLEPGSRKTTKREPGGRTQTIMPLP